MLHIPIVHAYEVSKQIPREKQFSIGFIRQLCVYRDMKHAGSWKSTKDAQDSSFLSALNARWRMNQLLTDCKLVCFKANDSYTSIWEQRKRIFFGHYWINSTASLCEWKRVKNVKSCIVSGRKWKLLKGLLRGKTFISLILLGKYYFGKRFTSET